MNPATSLLKSRKFLLLLLDTVISLTLLVGAWYLPEVTIEEMIKVIGILQPLFIFVIVSITAEDINQVRSEALVEASKNQAAPPEA